MSSLYADVKSGAKSAIEGADTPDDAVKTILSQKNVSDRLDKLQSIFEGIESNRRTISSIDDLNAAIDSAARDIRVDPKTANNETVRLARDLGLTVEQFLSTPAKDFSPEHVVAARRLLTSSTANLKALAKNVDETGDKVDQFLFIRALNLHKTMHQHFKGVESSAGKTLQAFNIDAYASKDAMAKINDIVGTNEHATKIAKIILDLEEQSPEATSTFLQKLTNAKSITRDTLLFFRQNALLSSPSTHMTNMMSNSFVLFNDMLERSIARGVTRPRS